MSQHSAILPTARTLSDKIGSDDPRYEDLIRRSLNKRFSGRPDYVRLVGSVEQVAEAIEDAIIEGKRFAVRSGGYCLESFVANSEVRVVIDMSLMTGISYDAEMGAFAVEAGATVGDVYRTLLLGWGVVLPAGESPNIGVGVHVLGGAFGFLCREHGLAVTICMPSRWWSSMRPERPAASSRRVTLPTRTTMAAHAQFRHLVRKQRPIRYAVR
jgi:FAD/FMN-containing dehydrogenase